MVKSMLVYNVRCIIITKMHPSRLSIFKCFPGISEYSCIHYVFASTTSQLDLVSEAVKFFAAQSPLPNLHNVETRKRHVSKGKKFFLMQDKRCGLLSLYFQHNILTHNVQYVHSTVHYIKLNTL